MRCAAHRNFSKILCDVRCARWPHPSLIGFNPSGPDSADKIVSDDCDPEFQKTVARRASHLQTIGEMAVHCADGNMPGRWDRPVFDVTPTEEEMSGILFL